MLAETRPELWTGSTIQRMLDEEIRYKNWRFIVQTRSISRFDTYLAGVGSLTEPDIRLRAEWMGPDAVTGQLEKQQSRWWPLSMYMVKTEIIQTALKCVFVAEEHEIREQFQYRLAEGDASCRWTSPFNSHIDIDTLARASEDVDVRVDIRPSAPANQRRE